MPVRRHVVDTGIAALPICPREIRQSGDELLVQVAYGLGSHVTRHVVKMVDVLEPRRPVDSRAHRRNGARQCQLTDIRTRVITGYEVRDNRMAVQVRWPPEETNLGTMPVDREFEAQGLQQIVRPYSAGEDDLGTRNFRRLSYDPGRAPLLDADCLDRRKFEDASSAFDSTFSQSACRSRWVGISEPFNVQYDFFIRGMDTTCLPSIHDLSARAESAKLLKVSFESCLLLASGDRHIVERAEVRASTRVGLEVPEKLQAFPLESRDHRMFAARDQLRA